jgi:hypothetical protein
MLISLLVILLCTFTIVAKTFSKQTTYVDQKLPSFNAISPYVSSNKYTSFQSKEIANPVMNEFVERSVINTEMGTVYLDMESLAFQFRNEDGYLWSSTVDTENSELSPNWKKRVKSAIHVESFNTNSNSFSAVEEYVLSDNTRLVTKIIDNGFESTITFGKSNIKILLRVRFLSSGIKIEIPNDSIIEESRYKLANISVYPYFGAVLEDSVPGYMFVPDGVGALVGYKKADASIISNYKKEIFGRNISYNTEANLNKFNEDGARIYAPVFGFVHGINQNAIFGNILNGSQYANLNISYAGRINNYNSVYAQFVFRRTYLQPVDMAGNTIALYQTDRHNYDISINYSSLGGSDANYVGMAKEYRKFLEDTNAITNKDSLATDIPLKIETIGIVKAVGELFSKSIKMTSISEFNEIISDFNRSGIENIVAYYSGYTSNGVNWSSPNFYKLSRKIGRKADVEKLRQLVRELYFIGEYQLASTKSSGYNTYNDLAKKINQQIYEYVEKDSSNYLLKHKKTVDVLNKSLSKLSEYGVSGIASNMLGRLSFQDFDSGVNLIDSARIYNEALKTTDLRVSLADANSYLWESMDAYYEFPMYSSQYLQFSNTVPFIPIVLSGSMDLFATNANFYAYARDELLRLIDFGVYPSFLVTNESSKKLEDTSLVNIYSSRYADLKDSVLVYYDFTNQALKHVQNSKIVNREVLRDGVVLITYDNDISILVNYLHYEFEYLGRIVKEKNYLVFRDNQVIVDNYAGGN